MCSLQSQTSSLRLKHASLRLVGRGPTRAQGKGFVPRVSDILGPGDQQGLRSLSIHGETVQGVLGGLAGSPRGPWGIPWGFLGRLWGSPEGPGGTGALWGSPCSFSRGKVWCFYQAPNVQKRKRFQQIMRVPFHRTGFLLTRLQTFEN